MKKYSILFCLIITLIISSCSKDKETELSTVINAPNEEIAKDFFTRFPGISEIAWSIHDNYNVAKFKTNYTKTSATQDREVEAWYLLSGSCEMIAADYTQGLPTNIDNAWKNSDFYKNGYNKLINAELVTRDHSNHIYKLEIADITAENEGFDLYYNTKAELISYLPDTNTPNNTKFNNLPTPESYKLFLSDNYPSNIVLSVYYDEDSVLGKTCDIDVFSNNKAYYIIFNDSKKEFYREHSFWQLNEVPQIIKDAINKFESGANNENTEIERVKDAKKTYYMIQINNIYFELNEKGEVIK